MVTNFLHLSDGSNKSISLYRIDPATGRIDSKAFTTTLTHFLKPGKEYLNDPTKYSLIPGSPETEKQKFALINTNPTLTSSEILQRLFGNKPQNISSTPITPITEPQTPDKPLILPNIFDQFGNLEKPENKGLLLAGGLILAAIVLK